MTEKNFGKKISDRILNLSIFATIVAYTIFGGFLLPFNIGVLSAPVNGSTSLGGVNSISVNKVYLNGVSETESLTVVPNSTVTVRVKYNNTGAQSVTDATIKDSLPAGFAIIPSSIKNCATPNTSDTSQDICGTVSNSVMTGSNIAVSPVAGLYNADQVSPIGTTNNSGVGTLEIGRKRYLNLHQCAYLSNPGSNNQDFFTNFVNNTSNAALFGSGSNASNVADASANCGPGQAAGGYVFYPEDTGVQSFNITAKRKLNLHQCTYASNQGVNGVDFFNNAITNFTYSSYYAAGTNIANSTDTTAICAVGNPATYLPYPDDNGVKSMDLFGKRYVNMHQCSYYRPSAGSMRSDFFTNFLDSFPNASFYGAGTNVSNTLDTTVVCAPATGSDHPLYPTNSAVQSLDLLDSARGQGYIEYKMTASPTAGTYGTNVTIQDAGTIAGANDITASASDAYISGTANSITVDPLSGTPTTIGVVNLSSGTCTSQIVGTSTTCDYPLVGDSNNNYTLPGSGITATVPGSTASPACSISSNGTTGVKLTCANVPTTGASTGIKAVPTSLGASPTASLTISSVPPTTIGVVNLSSGTCTPATVTLGDLSSCEYPLTGDASNNYTLPGGGIKAFVPGASAQSDFCSIFANSTTSAKIVCANTPTTGATTGTKQVATTLAGTATSPLTILAVTPNLGTPTATTASPVTGTIGQPLPTISLTGGNIPNGTAATFVPMGGAPITGTIMNGNFVPTTGSLIPVGSTTGPSTGTLKSAGATDVNVPTNFSAAVGPTLALKVILAGAYDTSTSMMKTGLRNKNLIPIAQPYNSPAFQYSGTEIMTTIPVDAVDWVLVELRQGSVTVGKKAGILKSNGDVVSTFGSGLTFEGLPTGSYQVIIRHRNHLAISTNTDVVLTDGAVNGLDMSGNVNVKSSNQRMLQTGVYGLRSTNVNSDSQINAGDRSALRTSSDAINTYFNLDANLDGMVTALDRTLVRLAGDSFAAI